MKKKQGFTLVELLVVVVIIAILTAAAIPMYEKATRKAQFVQVQTTLRALMQDVDTYTMENGYDTGDWNSLIQSVNCKSTTSWGQCSTDEGLYWTRLENNNVISINFVPSSKLFVNSKNSGYTFVKSIGQPWTWTNSMSRLREYYPVPAYDETFQMFCDWWINTGGRPASNEAKTVADASCK